MENDQRTQSINQLIKDIKSQKIVLPEFQRDFVWDQAKTYDLFDSIVKDIFIGAIIYGIPSFTMAVRQIDDRPRSAKGRRRPDIPPVILTKEQIEQKQRINKDDIRLVLDGQQRVTSLYRAITGVDSVWMQFKTDAELGDLLSVKKFEDCNLEELLFEFSGTDDDERLCIHIADVWKLSQGYILESTIRKDYFLKTKFALKQSLHTASESEIYFFRYIIGLNKIKELFNREKLLAHYLLDMGLDKFVLFFERSNTRGVQLNFIDILSAKLYPGNFNLKLKILAFERANSNYDLPAELIVRTIAYVVSKEAGKVLSVDRNYILSELGAEHFHKYWDEFVEYYKIVLDYLYENSIIISQNWMLYDSMVIPMMIFVRSVGGNFSQMNQTQKEFIHFWYWNAVFSNRYSGSSNERIIEDANNLTIIAGNKKIVGGTFFNKLTKTLIDKADDIYTYDRKSSATYKGILNLINYHSQGLIDWSNNSKLLLNSDLEDHHIFPKAYLSKTKQGIDSVDCVANRTLVPKKLNIKFSDGKPSHYLNELNNSNDQLLNTLENHLIPKDLLSGNLDMGYDVFLDHRIGQLFNLVKKYVIEPKPQLMARHYEEPKHEPTGLIAIFATYKNQRIEAFFNRSDKTIIYLEKHNDYLLVICCIDNLVKGASGQAVQNMNLMFGLDERSGLKLKSIGY